MTAETLDRQWRMLTVGRAYDGGTLRHFGGSGSPTVTGALGGTIQPMRSNLRGMTIPADYMTYTSGPRNRQRQEDEITRWVNWAKIAPPFGGGMQRRRQSTSSASVSASAAPSFPSSSSSPSVPFSTSSSSAVPDVILVSETVLFDSWRFKFADDAAVIGKKLENVTVQQGAPAIVARGGLALPSVVQVQDVHAREDTYAPPFVVATRFPNGATSVTAIGRTFPLPLGWVAQNRSAVTVELGQSPENATVGIFGRFATLSLAFTALPLSSSVAVWAQDLTNATSALDISSDVSWETPGTTGTKTLTLIIPGGVIDRIGTLGRSRADDVSPPGLVLKVVAVPQR
jgi:hypothetical protein